MNGALRTQATVTVGDESTSSGVTGMRCNHYNFANTYALCEYI